MDLQWWINFENKTANWILTKRSCNADQCCDDQEKGHDNEGNDVGHVVVVVIISSHASAKDWHDHAGREKRKNAKSNDWCQAKVVAITAPKKYLWNIFDYEL